MKEITRSDQLPDHIRTRIKEPMWDRIIKQLEREVQRHFDSYQRMLRGRVNRTYREGSLIQGYHDRAMLAELEKLKMGRLLEKAQQRIARQRKANRELQQRVHDLELQLEVTTDSLKDAYKRLYEDS